MNLEYFLAKCPRCGIKLTFDHGGCDHCRKCNEEFMKNEDYEASADLSIRIMDELDTRHLIIPKKKLEELKLLIQSSGERRMNDAEKILKEKIEHYQYCYRTEDELTFGTLVAILQGLLADIQGSGEKAIYKENINKDDS